MDTYLLIPVVLLLTGLIPVWVYRKKAKAPWNIVLLGAAAWIVSVALKSIFAFFFNTPINIFLASIYIPLYYVYTGLLTGIFEIFIPLLIIVKNKSKFESVNHQIGFGIGFGSIEAIVMGMITLLYFLAVRFLSGQFPPQVLAAISQSLSGTTPEFLLRAFAGGIERLSATMVHVFCSFMLFMFVYGKKKIYLIVPVILKTFTDGFALYFSAHNVFILYVEGFYLTIGLLCFFIMRKIMKSNNIKLYYE